jgi:hypothetical protein
MMQRGSSAFFGMQYKETKEGEGIWHYTTVSKVAYGKSAGV